MTGALAAAGAPVVVTMKHKFLKMIEVKEPCSECGKRTHRYYKETAEIDSYMERLDNGDPHVCDRCSLRRYRQSSRLVMWAAAAIAIVFLIALLNS